MSVDYAQIYWKQVQELQSKLELMQMKVSDLSVLCDRLEAKNKIMREALKFYAKGYHLGEGDTEIEDGAIARFALKSLEGEK